MDFRSLIQAFKRIRNILGPETPGEPLPRLYREDAEKALGSDFLQARSAIEGFMTERHYREAMETIASIAPSLDRFFVEVLVNCPEEDLKRNRLALLASIRQEFTRLADFSEIVVEKAEKGREGRENGEGREAMKRVFSFGNGVAEGAGLGKETLGGKGAGLAEMTALGVPVPPGFTIETSVCADFSRGASLDGIRAEVESALARLEHDADKRFGDPQNPLLVRSARARAAPCPG